MNCNISEFIGLTFNKVKQVDCENLIFISNTHKYTMYHEQNCCETVEISDITGDLDDLVGVPIIQASEETNEDNPPEGADSFTWTFYNIATIKGYVTIRWLGESNGYYSESVDIKMEVF